MKKETTKFIAEVYQRPVIWQLKHPHHKFRNIVNRMWDEVRGQFPHYNLTQLKKKWKNLKDTYRKELKKNPQMHTSDPNSSYVSQWQYFQDLDFLKHECRDLIDEDEEKSEGSDNDVLETYVEVTKTMLHSPSDSPTSHSDQGLLKRQFEMSSDSLEVERKKPKITEREQDSTNSETSDDYHFLLSILPEMKKLHPIQKMRLRNKINQALLEEMTLAMYGDPMSSQVKVDD